MLNDRLNLICEHSLRANARDVKLISRAEANWSHVRATLDGLFDDCGAADVLFAGFFGRAR